jgi:hypothetical protein
MKSENISRFSVSDKELKKTTKQEIKEGIDEHYGIEAGKNKHLKEDDLAIDDRDGYEGEDGGVEENIPPGLLDAENFFENNDQQHIGEVYDWYAKAMERRGRAPLERDSFEAHFFHGGSYDSTYMYGDQEVGYLLGHTRYGVFVPTHFAPKSIRKGYEMMKRLGGSLETPVVMSITRDLVETIKKMPEWNVIDTSFISSFRGHDSEKMIVYNSHPETRQLMYGLLHDYLKEQEQKNNWKEDEPGDISD